MNVWTYHDEIPKLARLDYWTGIPFMLFGNMLFLVKLQLVGAYVILLGAIFLFGIESPVYLLETVENDTVVDARLVDVRDFVFQFGISRHEVLSGPYFDDELEHLKQDLGGG